MISCRTCKLQSMHMKCRPPFTAAQIWPFPLTKKNVGKKLWNPQYGRTKGGLVCWGRVKIRPLFWTVAADVAIGFRYFVLVDVVIGESDQIGLWGERNLNWNQKTFLNITNWIISDYGVKLIYLPRQLLSSLESYKQKHQFQVGVYNRNEQSTQVGYGLFS